MTTATSSVTGSADSRSARADALLLSGTVVAAVLAFAVLAAPYLVEGFVPPVGLDALWGLGGSLSLVLAPVAAALAGAASGWTLWRRDDLAGTARGLHLLGVAVSLAFVAVLVSEPGRALVAWWQD
ncbi:hypothetical protein F4692_003489 [Nocardioides cavernae]|uniref:Uncharacterized protein n=1 Tax=Nocardioides cavernae TaxID=1921566 RepID=A0A7Y9H624_9ACTN|nr:hypothetical protein [Nocardioides cavernae]NYE38341.1 hypothetical protein [Nocardioides cavernae]